MKVVTFSEHVKKKREPLCEVERTSPAKEHGPGTASSKRRRTQPKSPILGAKNGHTEMDVIQWSTNEEMVN